jgi:hypothetical protein
MDRMDCALFLRHAGKLECPVAILIDNVLPNRLQEQMLTMMFVFPGAQCDIISQGSQVNPSVSVAMFVHGAITFTGTIVRILAQLFAGIVAFPIM